MQSKVPLYPYNAKTARERGEIEKWRESFRENCACAGAIEIAIRENFDGMHLKLSLIHISPPETRSAHKKGPALYIRPGSWRDSRTRRSAEYR